MLSPTSLGGKVRTRYMQKLTSPKTPHTEAIIIIQPDEVIISSSQNCGYYKRPSRSQRRQAILVRMLINIPTMIIKPIDIIATLL